MYYQDGMLKFVEKDVKAKGENPRIQRPAAGTEVFKKPVAIGGKNRKTIKVVSSKQIVATGEPHPMVVVPTKKGAVGVLHAGHHFEYHFTRTGRKIYRCAWFKKEQCQSQILVFERKVYVTVDEHSHGEPARMSDDVLVKSAVK